jgi:hypothetical protein
VDMKQFITARLWMSQPGIAVHGTIIRSEAALAGAITRLNKPTLLNGCRRGTDF